MHDTSKTYQEQAEAITLLKQRIQEPQESESIYKMLFSSAAEGILVAEVQTKQFIHANPALCRMFGFSEEEILHLRVEDIHPKDFLADVLSEFETLARGEKTCAIDIPCKRKDGSVFYADIRTAASMVLDGVMCKVGFFIDVTERKRAEEALRESEEQFRTIVNNLQDVVFRADLNGNITFASPSAAYTLGCSSTEEIIGLRISSDFYFDPNEAQHHMEMLQGCGKITRQKITLKRRDNGQPVIVSANIQFFHDNAGNILGIEGVYRDITDRIQAEKEREKLIRELQQALKEVKTLSSMLPICASCKKIRSDKGYWTQLEVYIKDHLDVEFSHGICDDCLKKLYPDVYKEMQQDDKP